MHRLIYIFIVVTLISCNNQNNSTDNSTEQNVRPKNTFAICFTDIDTSKVGECIGCTGGTYKRINDRYVVGVNIFPDLPVQLDSCYAITIDSSNGKRLTELLVFDKKDASLLNICTDVIATNYSQPTRKLYAQSGQLIIGFSDPTDYYGNQTHHTTVLIKRLVFIDDKTGDKIELENELLWKVLDLGNPG